MLTEQVVQGEKVILANNGALVASKSQAGSWHIVRLVGVERVCDCKSFKYRGRCSHVNVVEQLERERAAKRDTAILAGPAIDPPLFTERKPWKRPKTTRTFEEMFPEVA